MPTDAFDPRRLLLRFQTGEWDQHPLYGPAYHEYILGKQSDVTRLMEGFRVWREVANASGRRRNPALKRQSDKFFQKHIKSLLDRKTCAAHLRSLSRADRLLKTGELSWRFTVPIVIMLAIIHLRENLGRQRYDPVELHKLGNQWRAVNGQEAVNASYWHRVLKRPEILKLL